MTTHAELDRWNQRFAGPDYVFGTAPNAFLASRAERLKPGMTALAIGGGACEPRTLYALVFRIGVWCVIAACACYVYACPRFSARS